MQLNQRFLKYNAVSTSGDNNTVDFVIVDDSEIERNSTTGAVLLAIGDEVATQKLKAAGYSSAVETDLKTICGSYTAAMGTQPGVTITSETYNYNLDTKTVTMFTSLAGTAELNGFSETERAAFGFVAVKPVLAVTRDLSDLATVTRTAYRDGVKVSGPTANLDTDDIENVLYGDLGTIQTYREELLVTDPTSNWSGWTFVNIVDCSGVSVTP